MELIPGRGPIHEKTREQWVQAGARTVLLPSGSGGVRQEDLAAAIGISTASLRRIESGQNGAGVGIGSSSRPRWSSRSPSRP